MKFRCSSRRIYLEEEYIEKVNRCFLLGGGTKRGLIYPMPSRLILKQREI